MRPVRKGTPSVQLFPAGRTAMAKVALHQRGSAHDPPCAAPAGQLRHYNGVAGLQLDVLLRTLSTDDFLIVEK